MTKNQSESSKHAEDERKRIEKVMENIEKEQKKPRGLSLFENPRERSQKDIVRIIKVRGRTKVTYKDGEERYVNPREDVDAYIRSIRNKDKKEYAVRYAKWKLSGEKGEFPRAKNLSMMAEQAVFMNINKLFESKSNPREITKISRYSIYHEILNLVWRADIHDDLHELKVLYKDFGGAGKVHEAFGLLEANKMFRMRRGIRGSRYYKLSSRGYDALKKLGGI